MPQSPHRLRNDLKCVEWDVKPCTTNQPYLMPSLWNFSFEDVFSWMLPFTHMLAHHPQLLHRSTNNNILWTAEFIVFQLTIYRAIHVTFPWKSVMPSDVRSNSGHTHNTSVCQTAVILLYHLVHVNVCAGRASIWPISLSWWVLAIFSKIHWHLSLTLPLSLAVCFGFGNFH